MRQSKGWSSDHRGRSDRIDETSGRTMLLRRGDRGPAVADLRDALASLQLLPGLNGSDRTQVEFDDGVDRAIRDFQQRRGLIADGIVGPVTARSLTDARWTLGARILSHTLSAPLTGQSVRDFQRHRGLADDGVFGPQTYKELNRIGRMVTGGRPQYLREYQLVRQAGHRLHGKRIVIDPAHGADEAGWTIADVRSADLTYDIAQRLRSRMVTTGMSVALTRGADENPTQEQRAEFANECGADLLLSLHIDGSASPHACGIATFHFGTGSGATSTVGETLAGLVQRELVARTHFADCRVHHRPWDILRLTRMPAIQVEMGYLSNPSERDRLLSSDFRSQLADGILVAVKRLYLDGRDDPHTGTFTFSDLLAHEQRIRDSA